ncbi:TPA: hypothetical protein PX825_001192 [Escherichia coli]|nr:hypothetical protein [Escherichia coli]
MAKRPEYISQLRGPAAQSDTTGQILPNRFVGGGGRSCSPTLRKSGYADRDESGSMRLPVGPGDIFRPVAHGFMGDIVLFAVRQPGKATGPPCINYVVFFAQASIVYLALSFSSGLQICCNPKGVKFFCEDEFTVT